MKLGTVVYENKIYNLDYMTIDEMKILLQKIESDKKTSFVETKNILKKAQEFIESMESAA
jgi:hypothetical protein